ncbi:hypothetical protein ACHAWX_001083 [Stephanocyclus meneghinianus]
MQSFHSHDRPPLHRHDNYGSDYIGSIRALSAYFDDDDDDRRQREQDDDDERGVPSSPLPFAVDDDDEIVGRRDAPLLDDGRGASLLNSSMKGSFREDVLSLSHRRNGDEEDDDDGGIVILPSPEEDYEEEADDEWKNDQFNFEMERQSQQQQQQQPSIEPLDSIIMEAAAHIERQHNTTPINRENRDSLFDFDTLMQQAESGCATLSIEAHQPLTEHDNCDAPTSSFWDRFHRKLNASSTPSPASSSFHSPVRATPRRRNQFVVQVDILPTHECTFPELQHVVMDVMADVHLLHLWFDPIPIVLESTVLDGSGSYSPPNSSSPSPSSSSSPTSVSGSRGSNERPSNDRRRRRDGEWIEISTPPLRPPHDSHLSTCLRRIRVGVRSSLGFPERVRSVLLVERNAGRMGMTVFYGKRGSGGSVTVHHDFNVKREGERIVILDEVRLHPSDEEDEGGRRYYFYCFLCVMIRFIWRLVEWMFVRWYQPDLASYMAQTVTSLEKLRMLIEQEAAQMEREDLEGGNNADLISAPLLG